MTTPDRRRITDEILEQWERRRLDSLEEEEELALSRETSGARTDSESRVWRTDTESGGDPIALAEARFIEASNAQLHKDRSEVQTDSEALPDSDLEARADSGDPIAQAEAKFLEAASKQLKTR